MAKTNILKLAAVVLWLAFVSGCATEKLFNAIPKHEYVETVNSVYVTADTSKILVVSEKYHYIFDANDTVVATLKSSLSKLAQASFSNFEINGNKITGKLALYFPHDMTAEQKLIAKNLGYKELSGYYGLAVQTELSGTRYRAGNVVLDAPKTPLNRSYQVSILEDRPLGSKIGLIALTPVTIAADGVGFILASPIILLYSPIIIPCTINEDSCH